MRKPRPTLEHPFLSSIAFNGIWRLRTGNGEFLDVARDSDGAATHFVTVPISRLRHAFRVHRVADVRARRWHVELEPVPLDARAVATAPDGSAALAERTSVVGRASSGARKRTAAGSGAAKGGLRLPVDLAHHGCLDFELLGSSLVAPAPPAGARRGARRGVGATAAATAAAATNALPAGIAQLSLAMDAASVAAAPRSVGFPAYEGDAQRAFDSMHKQLKLDPHDARVSAVALDELEPPDDIPKSAWNSVLRQLQDEVKYRDAVRDYLRALETFVNEVFIPNCNLVDRVGGLIKLDGGQVVHLIIGGVFKGIASGVGALPVPGAGIVGAGLGVAFDYMLRDRGPSAATFETALIGARDGLAKVFNDLITAIQDFRADVVHDWGKLEQLGRDLLQEDGANQWPERDNEMRAEAARLLELALWKALLKSKWHHMTPSDNPSFLKDYGPAQKASYEAANPHYWVKYTPGSQRDLGKTTNGYYVEYHWLGYGSNALWHHEPDAAMCSRLFDKLGVTREELFTDTSWGLQNEVLYVQSGPMMAM